MALQFNHVNKGALEELFEKDLTRSLHQYHNDIVKKTLERKSLYNELKNNYIFHTSKYERQGNKNQRNLG